MRVEGDIRAARFEDGQHAHDQIEGALQAEADAGVGTDAEVAEGVREVVGASLEFPIGQVLLFPGQRYRVRLLPRLLSQEWVQTLGGGSRLVAVFKPKQCPAPPLAAMNSERR